MLPFLQPKKITSVIVARQKPEGKIEDTGAEGEPDHALLSVAEEIIKSIHAKDATQLAECLGHAFTILDSREDEEESAEPSEEDLDSEY